MFYGARTSRRKTGSSAAQSGRKAARSMKPAISVSAEMPFRLFNLTKTGNSRARDRSRREIAIRRRPMQVRSGFRQAPCLNATKGAVLRIATWHGNRMAQFRFRATDLYREPSPATRRPEQPSTVCKLRSKERKFRPAPSVGRIRFDPAPRILDEINDNADSMIAFNDDHFAIKQRFLGHGHRDRQWGYNNDDIAACADRQLTDDLGHEAITAADHLNGSPAGNAIVHADRIWNEVEDGSCVVVNLSEPADPDALRRAIVRARLQEEDCSETPLEFGWRWKGGLSQLATARRHGPPDTTWARSNRIPSCASAAMRASPTTKPVCSDRNESALPGNARPT